ncbi:hypothetical protein Cni_G12200 [Canna indica]|uniref:Uncharacterized protein n=1 Tax=Canna indica TaxID=4628 RepID=A0AAQ3QCH5_9LILI|nr:hypothetical protein Cni_G12200 [Canna indica]
MDVTFNRYRARRREARRGDGGDRTRRDKFGKEIGLPCGDRGDGLMTRRKGELAGWQNGKFGAMAAGAASHRSKALITELLFTGRSRIERKRQRRGSSGSGVRRLKRELG